MRFGIIGAMQQEVEILSAALTEKHHEQHGNLNFMAGRLDNIEVVILQSGIGKVAAAIGTTLMLDHFKLDYILNTGSAGGLAQGLNVGDVLISKEIAYHDVNVTAFGYAFGQLPNQPARYNSDAYLARCAQAVLQHHAHTCHIGLICTGDQFVCSVEQQQAIRAQFEDVIAIEMEAAAIAQVCHEFKVPFLVVRAISDVADKNSPMTFDEFLPLASKTSSQFVRELIQYVHQNPQA